VLRSGRVLARGVTIAIRYCAIRRQFQDFDAKNVKGENQVLNYTMVQYRLLPLLAATFALHFTGQNMIRMYQANQAIMERKRAHPTPSESDRNPGPEELQPGADLLAELHAVSCALKAMTSSTAGEGLETCRRACGGHGYSAFAGIGAWFADYLPTLTWEGDNYMLTQQVSRYLLKTAREVIKSANGSPKSLNDTGKMLENYWNNRKTGGAIDILVRKSDIVDAFAWRVGFLTFEALRHRDDEKRSWNSLLVDFWHLSTAFAQYAAVKAFYEALVKPAKLVDLQADTAGVLHNLFELYALHTLSTESSSFITSGACTIEQTQLVKKRVMQLMEEIRPHAIRLVDAWKLPDWQLNSSLGRSDGKVYEDLFHRANDLNPLNDIVIDPYPKSKALFRWDERKGRHGIAKL
jgi:acyl-CoA oxidase